MIHLKIDDRAVEVEQGSTLLAAARSIGIEIPTLCHLDDAEHRPSCMVCVVEVEGRATLVPACASRAEEGMVVRTASPRVLSSRRTSLELLLSDHAGDCVAPCTRTCPAGFDAAAMVAAISCGEIDDARRRVADSLPLAGVLGMICAGYCERACHRRPIDAAVAIGDLHGALAADSLARAPKRTPGDQRQADDAADVAIVGGGPAGIVAAWDLSRLGYRCTIFEASAGLGGALRQVEDMGRLPAGLLATELAALLQPDAAVHLEQALAAHAAVNLAALRKSYKAVILATGALPNDSPLRELLAAEGLSLNARGVQVDRHTMATNLPGLFAAGAVTGAGRNLALYVGQGRRAAAAIAAALSGTADGSSMIGATDQPAARWAAEEPSPSRLTSLSDEDAASLMALADSGPRVSVQRVAWDGSADSSQSASPRVVLGEADVIREARRCLQCTCDKLLDCQLRELAIAWQARPGHSPGSRRPVARDASHPLVVYDSGKCIQCGICLGIAGRHKESLGLAFIGRGFQVRTAAPFGETLDAALRVAARECAAGCPTGALALKRGR